MSKQQVSKTIQHLSQDKNPSIHEMEQIAAYSGPIPHPNILKGLGEIDASFPDRVMKIAENHASTEDESQKKIIKLNAISIIMGQIFSFIFGLAALAVCVYMARNKIIEGTVVSGVVLIVQLIISGISSGKNQKS